MYYNDIIFFALIAIILDTYIGLYYIDYYNNNNAIKYLRFLLVLN